MSDVSGRFGSTTRLKAHLQIFTVVQPLMQTHFRVQTMSETSYIASTPVIKWVAGCRSEKVQCAELSVPLVHTTGDDNWLRQQVRAATTTAE